MEWWSSGVMGKPNTPRLQHSSTPPYPFASHKTMKTAFILLLALALTASAERLKIVTTTSDLAAIAQAVAGDRAEVRSISTGKEDPHMLQAKPSVILLARDADLWIRIGLDLEIGWEPPILDGSRNTRIRIGTPGHLDASGDVLVLDRAQCCVTRAMGDVHALGNPHYWLDPLNGGKIAGTIATRLAELRPDDADYFRERAAAFQRALDERMAGTWKAAMEPLRGQKIVTYHKSWIYFANRFDLEVVAELEPKPGVPPTAAHLETVAEIARNAEAKIILQEPFYSTKAAERVAEQVGARVVVVANSVGGQPEATDYLALMDLIVNRISDVK